MPNATSSTPSKRGATRALPSRSVVAFAPSPYDRLITQCDPVPGPHTWTAWIHGEGSRAQPRGLGKHRGRRAVVQEAAGLVLPQPGVGSVETQQLLVRANLGDLAAVEHDQLVHARDRAQPMRDHERGPALHEPPQRLLDKGFAL